MLFGVFSSVFPAYLLKNTLMYLDLFLGVLIFFNVVFECSSFFNCLHEIIFKGSLPISKTFSIKWSVREKRKGT